MSFGRRGPQQVRADRRTSGGGTPTPKPPLVPAAPRSVVTPPLRKFWQCVGPTLVLNTPMGLPIGEVETDTVILENARFYDMFDDMWIETTGEAEEVVYTRRSVPWSVPEPKGDPIWIRAMSMTDDGTFEPRELASMDEVEPPAIDLTKSRCAHALDCVVNDATQVAAIFSPSSPVGVDGMRDWNSEYQELLEGLMFGGDDVRDAVRGTLDELVQDFLQCVEEVIPVIITEMFVPANKRTVPAIGIPGQGTYVAEGIYFRLCIDTPAGLFGGDANAMKVANQVHKAATTLTKVAPFHFLHVPLSTVVTMLGYRVIAQSIPPLRTGSLVAGSADGGRTFVQPPSVVSLLLRNCAAELNLKVHDVGGQVQFGFPLDMQVHAASDGRMYLMNTWRLFPCSLPLVRYPYSHVLTWRIRPEVMLQCDSPLSSDAFVIGASVTDDNIEVGAMVQWIRDCGIPMVSAMLSFLEPLPFVVQEEEKRCTICDADLRCAIAFHCCWSPKMCCATCGDCYAKIVWENDEAKDWKPTKCAAPARSVNGYVMEPGVTRLMHELGINMRYMNYIMAGIRRTAMPCTQHHMEIEMIARSAKSLLTTKLRSCRGPEEAQAIVTTLLQGLLHAGGEHADEFWSAELGPYIQRKFAVTAPFETSRLDRFLVYDRLQRLTGVMLTAESVHSLHSSEPTITLQEITPIIKTLIIPRLSDPTGSRNAHARSLVPQMKAFWAIRFDTMGHRDVESLPTYLK